MVLGGDWLVVLLAATAAVLVDLLQRHMGRRRLPAFYQQVAGGLDHDRARTEQFRVIFSCLIRP